MGGEGEGMCMGGEKACAWGGGGVKARVCVGGGA